VRKFINNSHWCVTQQYNTNAVGGKNRLGQTIFILQKRKRKEIEIPLNVWRNIVAATDAHRIENNLEARQIKEIKLLASANRMSSAIRKLVEREPSDNMGLPEIVSELKNSLFQYERIVKDEE
jgi:hypothetical protein